MSSPWIASTAEFQANSIFGSAKARSCMILEARSSSRRWIRVTLAAKRDRKVASSSGGVAAADDRDVLVAEEEAVAGRAPGDAVAGEPVLALDAELAVARARGQDHRAGAVLGAGAVGDHLDVAGQVDRGDVVGDQLGAEALGLGAHLVHQLPGP